MRHLAPILIRFFVLPVPAVAVVCNPLVAQSPPVAWRFDMGPSGSPVANGFTPITLTSVYSSPTGYGWLVAPSQDVLRSPPHPNVQHNLDADLICDSATTLGACRFRADVPDGQYYCVAYLGDLGEPNTGVFTPLEGMDVIVGSTQVVSDAFARTAKDKARLLTAWGGYKRVGFIATASGSNGLEIEFQSNGIDVCSIMGLEIYPYVRPPIWFDHPSRLLVVRPIYQGLLQTAVNKLNSEDYAGARADLDNIPTSGNEVPKAWGYAWLAGWLTGDESDVDVSLLDTIRGLLSPLPQTESPVVSLLLDTNDFAKGELFSRSRGYSPAAFPENPDSLPNMLLNSCAAVQLLEQLDDDILAPVSTSHRPDCPYFAKAQYLIARNMYTRNTGLALGLNNVFASFNTYMLGIFDALWYRLDPSTPSTQLFPAASDPIVLAWFLRSHLSPTEPLGPLQPWNGTSLPPIDPTQCWFAQRVNLGTVPAGTPAWAEHQRAYAKRARNLAVWWDEARRRPTDPSSPTGEWGGGGGDDVEGAGALSVPMTVMHKSRPSVGDVELGIQKVLETVLSGPEVDWDQGFYGPGTEIMDAEHAGEYTSYPLYYLSRTFDGSPRYLEFSMRTLRNLDESAASYSPKVSWSDIVTWSPPNTTWRHLKAFRLGANNVQFPNADPSHGDLDITENMKCLLPIFTVLDYNHSQRLCDLGYQYAQAWAGAAMATPGTTPTQKPAGVFPVGVDFSDGTHGGTGNWWEAGDPAGGDVGLWNFEHYYLALTMWREHPLAPSVERNKLLEPMWRVIQFVSGANTADTTALPGTANWTAARVKTAAALIAYWGRDEILANVPGAQSTVLDAVFNAHGPTYLKYLNSPPGLKNKSFANNFARSAKWLEYFWPLATTAVSYTDRIKFDNPAPGAELGIHVLNGMRSGGNSGFVPNYPVSWVDPEPNSGALDLAVLVNEVHANALPTQLALKVLLYNFDTQTRNVELRVLRSLPRGDYLVTMGPDANEDDVMDSVTWQPANPVPFAKRGDSLTIPVPPGQLQVLDLVYSSPASTPSLLDLAIGPDDLRDDGIGNVEVEIHNLGNVGYNLIGKRVNVYDDATGAMLGSQFIPPINAPTSTPTGLDPQSVVVPFTSVPAVGVLRAELKLVGVAQISTANDKVVRSF